MMTAEQLKDGILLFAMQGKLSTGCSSDLAITSVLKKIYKNKGRITPIDSEQIPYDLPEKWEWARLEDITDNCDNPFADGPFGSNLKREHYTEKHEVRIIQLSNIGENGWKDANEKYTTYEHLKTIERSKVNAGDIVIAKMMPAGRAIEVPESDYAYVLSSDAVKFVAHPLLNKRFLLMAINSPVFREQVYSEVHGVTRVRTSLSKLKSYIVPLPPLEEQKRIVAKIEELMPFVDQYATASTKLNTLNATFPEQMKKSILQQAVMGKLVPQDPSDESASLLLKKIAEEKKRLIKEGKIKKQKPLPEITEDDKIFDIPESWEWVRLTDIGEISRGRSQYRPRGDQSLYVDGIYPLVQTGDVASAGKYLTEYTTMYNEKGLEQSRMWAKGTLCITIAANIGDVAILGFDACFPDSVVGFSPFSESVSSEYVYYLLQAFKPIMDAKSTKVAQKNLNVEKLSSIWFPLPPSEEQKRIVSKLDGCLSILQKIIHK